MKEYFELFALVTGCKLYEKLVFPIETQNYEQLDIDVGQSMIQTRRFDPFRTMIYDEMFWKGKYGG